MAQSWPWGSQIAVKKTTTKTSQNPPQTINILQKPAIITRNKPKPPTATQIHPQLAKTLHQNLLTQIKGIAINLLKC